MGLPCGVQAQCLFAKDTWVCGFQEAVNGNRSAVEMYDNQAVDKMVWLLARVGVELV